jgi:hypothetical protein
MDGFILFFFPECFYRLLAKGAAIKSTSRQGVPARCMSAFILRNRSWNNLSGWIAQDLEMQAAGDGERRAADHKKRGRDGPFLSGTMRLQAWTWARSYSR